MSKKTLLSVALGFVLCLFPAAADTSPLEYLNTVLADSPLALPDDPGQYAIYGSLEARLRDLAAVIRKDGSLRDWYDFEAMILGDFIDLAQQMHDIVLARAEEGTGDDQGAGLTDVEVDFLTSRAMEILRTARYKSVQLFSDEILAAVDNAFFDLRQFEDPNATNTFLAILFAERSYLLDKLDSPAGDETALSLEQDILLMNLVLLQEG